LNQSFTNWECLLGVETSNDNTEAIAKEYVEKDPRFKISITPKSGSCSATRNIGIDTTSGEYVIFLDGDDYLIENSLQRLYDKISARPGADLYPCAIQVENEMTGQYEELRDNYPQDFDKELTGAEATLFIHSLKRHPEPMMQLTICRRQFLLDHNLKCVYGLRGQDREFSPRALYWAKRVIPLHEPFYLYRKRIGSIVVSTSLLKKLQDQVIINKSLLAFHASVCKQPDFDKRLTICWGRSWSSWMFFWWFNPDYLKKISRADRLKTLEALFSDGFGDFKALLKGGALSRRIAGWWMRAFVRHPSMRYAAESFFRLYFHYCQ
jgi:glycosyltransferase involved in cell wall biosynthesis